MWCVFIVFMHKHICMCVYPLHVYMLIPTTRVKDILWSKSNDQRHESQFLLLWYCIVILSSISK